MQLPTILVTDKDTPDPYWINESDFDSKVHRKASASDEAKAVKAKSASSKEAEQPKGDN